MNKLDNLLRSQLEIPLIIYQEKRPVSYDELQAKLDLESKDLDLALKHLLEMNFLEEREAGYWLGIKNFILGILTEEKLEKLHTIEMYLKFLLEDVDTVVTVETLDFGLGKRPKSLIIYKDSNNPYDIEENPKLGCEIDAEMSSSGQCFLAYINKDQERLNKLEKDGYLSLENSGIYYISAPSFNKEGAIDLTITLSGPIEEMKNNKLEKRIQRLLQTSNLVTEINSF